ncbi:hypothetical protein ACN47E_007438 [Coniothyrium glycines]
MMPSTLNVLRANQRHYIAALVLFLVFLTIRFGRTINGMDVSVIDPDMAVADESVGEELDQNRIVTSELRDAIVNLFKTIKIDPKQHYYRDSKGKYYTGAYGNESTWQQPMGGKVLIVDIDTRVPNGENQILDFEKKMDWDSLPSGGAGLVSHAIINHYLYAMIHGYDYRYYQALDMPDHYPTWISPHIVKELLPDYQFLVTMDADVVISHMEIPLEWMFNRWGIAKHTSMALPHDTEEFVDGVSKSTDSKGVPVLNTGFVVAQNNQVTFDMLDAWVNCTTEVRYPGCAKWKHEWSHEQRAFSEYIRYDFGKVPGTIVGIPCDDAMGYPNFKADNDAKGNVGISDCNGNFVRHYTTGKDMVHAGGGQTIAQIVAEVLQKDLLSQQNRLVIKEEELVRLPSQDAPATKQPWEEVVDAFQEWELDPDAHSDLEQLLQNESHTGDTTDPGSDDALILDALMAE